MKSTRPSFVLFVCLLLTSSMSAQSSRTPVLPTTEQLNGITAQRLFEDTDAYVKKKLDGLEQQKQRPDDKIFQKLRQEQRDQAAKYVNALQSRGPQIGDDLYYLGRLQYLAGDAGAALESLRLFLLMKPDSGLAQVARPLAISCALSQRLVDEAEQIAGDYERYEPQNWSVRFEIENQFAAVFRGAADFESMATHAKAMYKIARQAMNYRSCKMPRCEEMLANAVGLVAEAYQKQNRLEDALGVLERLQGLALSRPSAVLFLLATQQLAQRYPATDPWHVFEISRDAAQKLPELAAIDWIDTQPTKLSELRGRVVLIDFWATWCGPCRVALPELRRLDARYRDKGLIIIGATKYFGIIEGRKASHEEELAYLRDFKKKNDLSFGFAIADSDNDISNYGVLGIPTYFLIDRRGYVRVIGPTAGSRQVPLLVAFAALACLSAGTGLYLCLTMWFGKLFGRK